MKKIIIAVVALIVLALAGGAGYYFFVYDDGKSEPRPPKDLTGIIVLPVEFPMKGKTFVIPNTATNTATTSQVILDLVFPTAKRDYPMARFTGSDGITVSQLVALDDFTTSVQNNVRAVPIMVSSSEIDQAYYLAILEGDEMKHTTSLPIGDMIKIQSVTREGNTVTVNYLVHDRLQEVTEIPRVPTTAIFDIAAKSIVQAGRIPKNETYVETKSFAGEYLWQETSNADGSTVTPGKPDTFTLLFDANRINLGTDCNSGSATFVAESGSSTKFTIDTIAQTKMFCESAQEADYFAMVAKISNYDEASDGTLTFDLSDGGSMVFAPKVKKLEFAATSTEAL
ncbi:META domain-containing protein [Patescibacteria group bacterium]|nr:META domain-containing protein [Patescibacteria group bacterium]